MVNTKRPEKGTHIYFRRSKYYGRLRETYAMVKKKVCSLRQVMGGSMGKFRKEYIKKENN